MNFGIFKIYNKISGNLMKYRNVNVLNEFERDLDGGGTKNRGGHYKLRKYSFILLFYLKAN